MRDNLASGNEVSKIRWVLSFSFYFSFSKLFLSIRRGDDCRFPKFFAPFFFVRAKRLTNMQQLWVSSMTNKHRISESLLDMHGLERRNVIFLLNGLYEILKALVRLFVERRLLLVCELSMPSCGTPLWSRKSTYWLARGEFLDATWVINDSTFMLNWSRLSCIRSEFVLFKSVSCIDLNYQIETNKIKSWQVMSEQDDEFGIRFNFQ